MSQYEAVKRTVLDYFDAIEGTEVESLDDVLGKYIAKDYLWQGVHPFREIFGIKEVTEQFWKPLKKSLRNLQRRQDVLLPAPMK